MGSGESKDKERWYGEDLIVQVSKTHRIFGENTKILASKAIPAKKYALICQNYNDQDEFIKK